MADSSIHRTLVAQVCLCASFYLALKMGQSKNYDFLKIGDENPLDFYFISVWGGSRSAKEEILLLKQMEKMAKVSHAKFVLHIRDPGKNDRLMQNGMRYFSLLKVPWHGIQVSRGNDTGYFIERMKLQYGQTLDIIAIDTGLLLESLAMGLASDTANSQLRRLKRTLQTSNSNWRIVVGLHPLVTCEDNTRSLETKHLFESIHRIFIEYGVNAYLSRRGCAHNIRIGSTAYIGFSGLVQTNYFPSRKSALREFLLHRVSSLETVFYYVNTAGYVHRTELQRKGRMVI